MMPVLVPWVVLSKGMLDIPVFPGWTFGLICGFKCEYPVGNGCPESGRPGLLA